MQKLLVDTAAWAALELANDEHQRGIEFRQEAGQNLSLGYHQLDYLGDCYTAPTTCGHMPKPRSSASGYGSPPAWTSCRSSPPHEMLAWDIFRHYADKDSARWTASALRLMKTMRITSAFTFDRSLSASRLSALPVALRSKTNDD